MLFLLYMLYCTVLYCIVLYCTVLYCNYCNYYTVLKKYERLSEYSLKHLGKYRVWVTGVIVSLETLDVRLGDWCLGYIRCRATVELSKLENIFYLLMVFGCCC